MKARRVRSACSPSTHLWRGLGGVLILAVMTVAAMGREKATVGTKVSYEQQLVIQASQLAPAGLLQGARFRVDEQEPTDGFLGRFTL